jgi:hypothetical protein
MGIVAGLVSGAGALAGMFGSGGASDVQLPPQFNMPNMGPAANNAFGGIQGLGQYTDLATSTMPYAQNTFQGLYNNPYAGQAQQGANVGAGLGENAALGAYGTGGMLQSAGLGTIPYASSIMQTGFDPQNALYARTQQQVQDQTRAGLEARGVDSTPYGAGIEGQQMSNFNIDWQNALLGRETAAAGAAGTLLNQGAGVANLGTGIQNQAPGQYATAAAMPYATATGIGQGQNQAITSLLGQGSGAQGLAQQPIGDWLSYLQTGNQAGGVANQQAGLALQQQQQGFNQQQIYGKQLGSALYGLGGSGNPFANLFGGGGGGNPNAYSFTAFG